MNEFMNGCMDAPFFSHRQVVCVLNVSFYFSSSSVVVVIFSSSCMDNVCIVVIEHVINECYDQ